MSFGNLPLLNSRHPKWNSFPTAVSTLDCFFFSSCIHTLISNQMSIYSSPSQANQQPKHRTYSKYHTNMRIIERQMPCSSVKCPHALYASLRRLCDRKGYEIESLELRNDTYFIRLRVPELNAVNKINSQSFLDSSIIDKLLRRTMIRRAPLIDHPILRPQTTGLPRNAILHRRARNKACVGGKRKCSTRERRWS